MQRTNRNKCRKNGAIFKKARQNLQYSEYFGVEYIKAFLFEWIVGLELDKKEGIFP